MTDVKPPECIEFRSIAPTAQ